MRASVPSKYHKQQKRALCRRCVPNPKAYSLERRVRVLNVCLKWVIFSLFKYQFCQGFNFSLQLCLLIVPSYWVSFIRLNFLHYIRRIQQPAKKGKIRQLVANWPNKSFFSMHSSRTAFFCSSTLLIWSQIRFFVGRLSFTRSMLQHQHLGIVGLFVSAISIYSKYIKKIHNFTVFLHVITRPYTCLKV